MKFSLVSVLMTAYNREKYIKEAIESVLASTYQNFELIIVDDGSTDNTLSIIKDYEEKDSRIKVFVNQYNLGDYPNRNKAASYAKGKYLKYVDGDDYIYPWGLSLLVKMMEQFPEAGWGLCSLPQNKNQPFPFQLKPSEAYEYHYIGKGLFHKAPLSSIIKKEIFEKVGEFNNIRMAGDFDMWHRLGQNFPVVLMPEGIVWYRVHENQEMSDYNKYEMSYEKIKKKYLFEKDCPLEKNQINFIRKQIIKKNIKNTFKNLLHLKKFKSSLKKTAFWIS